jgi:hypothetical protein
MPRQLPQQIAIRQRPQYLRPIAKIIQAFEGKYPLSRQSVFRPETVQRRQRRPISMVEALQCLKQLGFRLMVARAVAVRRLGLRCGVCGPVLWLRR